jgi:hypothetical protein
MRFCVVTDIHSRPTQAECLSMHLSAFAAPARFALNELCGRPDLKGEALHKHLFHEGGISDAVVALRETLDSGFVGLGYSAGGTLLWRAAAQGLPFASIFCISSTRLRNETSIATPNHVFFGAEDPNKPAAEWLSTVPDRSIVFPDAGHGYYLHPETEAARKTQTMILQNISKLSTG